LTTGFSLVAAFFKRSWRMLIGLEAGSRAGAGLADAGGVAEAEVGLSIVFGASLRITSKSKSTFGPVIAAPAFQAAIASFGFPNATNAWPETF